MALPAEPRADLPPPRRCLPPPPLLRSHRPTPTGERKIGRELAIQLLPRHPTHDAGSSRALAASPRSDIPAAPPACGLPADVPYLPLYFIWQVLAASPPVQSRHHGAAPKPAGFSGQIRPSPPLDHCSREDQFSKRCRGQRTQSKSIFLNKLKQNCTVYVCHV
ncbi:uncharacterized protein LOC112894132 isoform X2 [Panicum hallii]|uniref:uncharacterized protein LOC112894132 isoform X2 n=1 Tax=Panicum hallii TaxID=206008 RepID=UPI000DF4E066|nr:uncharacterized protein LOC112894132 isoform X2 [Panicum hallii]